MSTLTDYLRPDLIATVKRLDLRAKFIVEGFITGLHASPYHGFSVEFSEHRKYALGDDLRLLDWNVFAKTDRLYIKKFQAETNLSAFLILDQSASMGFPTPDQLEPGGKPRMTKFDYAVCIAATLGHLMIGQQDAVGLFSCDGGVRSALPAKSKHAHLIHLIGELARASPTGQTQLATSLHEVARRIRKRSLMIILSDLLCDPEPLIDALHHLRFRGHDLIIFRVWDEAEVNFPFRDPTRFEGLENDGSVIGDAQSLRAAYLDEVSRVTSRFQRASAALQADFVPVHTAMNFDEALLPFLINRQKRF